MNQVNEKFSQLETLLNSSTTWNYASLQNIIQDLTLLMQSSQHRNSLEVDHCLHTVKVCSIGLQVISKIDYTIEDLKLVADILRFLRNACGGPGKTHLFISSSQEVLEFASKALNAMLHKEKPEEITVLKICIQLFGNFIVLNEKSKSIVWNLFFKNGVFKHLLNSSDSTVQEYTMMVLYNSLTDENCRDILTSNDGHGIMKTVTDSLLSNFVDWGMLFVECLLKREEFRCCYRSLPLENRLLILDIIIEHLKRGESDETALISVVFIENVKNRFIDLVKEIAQLCNANTSLEPAEFVKILSLLCTASVCNIFIPYMHSCKDLLEKCIETLKCVHLLGKEGSNVFSSVSGSKILSAQCNEKIANHPLFGFKKDLIKLIGNLCYGCKGNQDLVRTLDGIPLVLDCCKLDAKNPYIMQWCILAIRNIVYQNQENQAVLAGITTAGEIEDSALLKEIGIQVRYKDGKLSLS